MSALVEAPLDVIRDLGQQLTAAATPLPQKYRALFSLRNVQGEEAHKALSAALQDASALLRHEVAFCMGQRQDPLAIQQLKDILNDPREHAMVRHEAGEALGAIGTEDCLVPLREHQADGVQEVAETCQLALQRIEFFQEHPEYSEPSSRYYSVDPTPPFGDEVATEELRRILLDEGARMFDRYRALFALRNRGSAEATAAMCATFACTSALLKHEVAYVLGQLQDPTSIDTLTHVLKDPAEHAMVRHEAAEALGAIADSPALQQLLRDFQQDAEPIVAHSCAVALDMLEFEQAGGFDYCTSKYPQAAAAAEAGGGGDEQQAAAEGA